MDSKVAVSPNRFGWPLAVCLAAAVTLTPSRAPGQTSLPSLAATRIAADSGDPAAQDSLAEAYLAGDNHTVAVDWFKKAAAQGCAHAQWRLGQIYQKGYSRVVGKSGPVPLDRKESMRWYLMAAKQGYTPAEFDLGRIYETGAGVPTDRIEAYKFYRLAYAESDPAKKALNQLVLGFDAKQIAEAEKRAADFAKDFAIIKPVKAAPSELDQLPLTLNGISGETDHRLAIINGATFAAGESGHVTANGKSFRLHCVEIKDDSVVVQLVGTDGNREIYLK